MGQLSRDGITVRKMGEEEEKEKEEEEEEKENVVIKPFPREWFVCVLPQDSLFYF